MADALQIAGEGVIYEVFHSNKGGLDDVDYNIYLTIYNQNWTTPLDLLGPKVMSFIAIDNPYNITSGSFELYATLSDVETGMSDVMEVEYAESPTSISDPEYVHWSLAGTMDLSGIGPTVVANVTVTPVIWNPGEVHRLWVRGQDSAGNWGTGSYLDIVVIGKYVPPPPPPFVQTVEFSGLGNADMTITWSLSSNDSSPNFDGYEIYAGSYYNPGLLEYRYITSLGPGNTIYTHVGAGMGDLNTYYYVVISKDTNGLGSASPTQGAKIARHFTTGSHLVSIPLNLSTDDLSTVLGTLDYNVAWWYDPTDTLDHWKSHNPSKSFNEFDKYNRTMAIWVDVASGSYLTLAGMLPNSTDIPIYDGWNLIGYPSLYSKKVAAALSAISWERVEGFGETSPPQFLELLGDDDRMEGFKGYWVKASSPGMLTITNP